MTCADVGLGGASVGCGVGCTDLDLSVCDPPSGYGNCVQLDPTVGGFICLWAS